jgi:pimeloyl-ACP methyl ester carboxylesterase
MSGSAHHAIRKSYVDTARGQIHVRSAGDGEHMLVMLQILPFGSQLFEALMPVLAECGYHAVALDLMGYGRSDKRDDVWLIEDFAANIEDALARLEIRPTRLLSGHFSSMVATEIAAKANSGVAALAIDGPPLWSAETRQSMRIDPAMAGVPIREDGEHAIEYWRRTFGMLRRLNPGLEVSPATDRRIRDCFISFLETTYEPGVIDAFASYDLIANLPRIAVPTLVLGAENDSQRAHFETAQALIPNSRGHLFPGTHPVHDFPNPDRAREYAKIIDAFFESVTAP